LCYLVKSRTAAASSSGNPLSSSVFEATDGATHRQSDYLDCLTLLGHLGVSS